MKLLINNENVVIDYGVDFSYNDQGEVIKKSGNTVLVTYAGLNSTNSQIVNIADELVPPQVAHRYKYVNGQFLRNTQYRDTTEDSMFNVYQLLDSYTPKSGTVDERLEKLIDFVLEIAERPQRFFDVDANLVAGLKLRNENPSTLSTEQLTQYKLGQNYINKMRARLLIDAQVGDVYDLIADLSKKLGIVTGLLVRLYRHTLNNVAIPTEIKANYDSFTQQYAQAVDGGTYLDRSDVETDLAGMIQKLMTRDTLLANLVKTEYLDKKL